MSPPARQSGYDPTICLRHLFGFRTSSHRRLPAACPCLGNFRELEQCVRNILVRGRYTPPQRTVTSFHDALARGITEGSLTIDELLRRYCTLVYAQAGSYEEAARRLQVDRRTVKTRVDRDLLEQLHIRRVPQV